MMDASITKEVNSEPKREVLVFHLCHEIDNETKYTMFGTVLNRIRKFCDRFDTEANGKEVAKAVEHDFIKETALQEFMIIIALDGGEIVGHLLAHLDYYYGNWLVYIHQLELDEARVSIEEKLRGLQMVNDWAKMHRATKIKGAAITKRHAERLQQVYGFVPEMTLLGKAVQ